MSDSTNPLNQVSQSAIQRETTINANFAETSPAAIFAYNAVTSAALTWGYMGGRLDGTLVASGTVALTTASTNYIVAHRTTLAVTVSTATTNWLDTTTYGRLYKVVAGGSTVTSYEDHRAGGIFVGGAGGVGVSDGDKGDITVSSSGAVWTVDNDVVTNAKAANMATGTVKYRRTAGTGDPEDSTLANLKSDLLLTGTNSGDQTITLTSHVTGSGTGSFATTLSAAGVAVAQALTEAPADLAYTGLTVNMTYGASLVPGDVVYFDSTGVVLKADANAAGKFPALGMAMETASSGSHVVLLLGIYRNDALYALTVGGLLYLSTTAGAVTQTQPSATDDCIQVLGVATHADRILLNPQLNYLTHV